MTVSSNDSAQALEPYFLPIRVYIEDTDAGGIVFHAKYLHYMERARTEWVRHRGVGLRSGLGDNISYVVQKLSIHYAAPAYLDDELEVTADLVNAGRVWMEFDQKVTRKVRNGHWPELPCVLPASPWMAADHVGCLKIWASCSSSTWHQSHHCKHIRSKRWIQNSLYGTSLPRRARWYSWSCCCWHWHQLFPGR